jgi:hypothetical protein
MPTKEMMHFGICLAVSFVLHMIFVYVAMPGVEVQEAAEIDMRIADRFASEMNRVVPLDDSRRQMLEQIAAEAPKNSWRTKNMGETFAGAAAALGVPVNKVEVFNSLDATHSRQGRMDILVDLNWEIGRDANDFHVLAFLAGEGTLKSDFSSHRLWVTVQGKDGKGRVAIETMDCRYYRNGKLSDSDLLYRATWVSE